MSFLYQLKFDDGAVYFGVADDLRRRVAQHERGARRYAGRVNFSYSILAEGPKPEMFQQESALIAAALADQRDCRNEYKWGAAAPGRVTSEETKAKISAAKKGKPCSALLKLTPDLRDILSAYRDSGESISGLSRLSGLARATVRRGLNQERN